MQVTIVVDVDNADHVAFWEKQNPSVLEMAKGSQVSAISSPS